MPNIVTVKNNLQTYNPAIDKEWHPTKNGGFVDKELNE
jgi:hypothetical protein